MPDMTRDGYDAGLGYTTFRRENEIVFTVRWTDAEEDRVLDETGLLVFDIGTGRTEFSSVTGCGGAAWGAEGADGSIYWSSGAYEAAVYGLSDGGRAGATCVSHYQLSAPEPLPENCCCASTPNRWNSPPTSIGE